MGQMPTLELDDGCYLAEITAICEYLEEKNPTPPLIGSTPEQRAECRMWTRRVDLNICEPLANGYRFGEALKFFEKRIPVRAGSLARPQDDRGEPPEWLNGQIAGKHICAAALHAGGYPLRLARFRQPGRPAADPANANIALVRAVGRGRRRRRNSRSFAVRHRLCDSALAAKDDRYITTGASGSSFAPPPRKMRRQCRDTASMP